MGSRQDSPSGEEVERRVLLRRGHACLPHRPAPRRYRPAAAACCFGLPRLKLSRETAATLALRLRPARLPGHATPAEASTCRNSQPRGCLAGSVEGGRKWVGFGEGGAGADVTGYRRRRYVFPGAGGGAELAQESSQHNDDRNRGRGCQEGAGLEVYFIMRLVL